MTAKEIIENNQILTLDKAKSLIGKTILITNPEDKSNEPQVREVEVNLVTAYDHYTKVIMPRLYGDDDDEKVTEFYYNNVIKPKEQELRDTFVLYDSKGDVTAHCYPENDWFDVPTFCGSDENRPIYYTIEF